MYKKNCCSKNVIQPNKELLIKNLNRIEGQVRGISKMLVEDRYCIDILNQISAVRASLRTVSQKLLANHLRGCVANSQSSKEASDKIEELLGILLKAKD